MADWVDKFDRPISGKEWYELTQESGYARIQKDFLKDGTIVQTDWEGSSASCKFITRVMFEDERPNRHEKSETRVQALATHYKFVREYDKKTRFDFLAEEL